MRVNALIKRELGQLLLREFEFPPAILMTLTRVETSPNLLESKVFISVLPEKETERIIGILNKKIYFLQQKINQRLKMRPLPKIRFLAEKTTVQASQIEEILEKLKSKK